MSNNLYSKIYTRISGQKIYNIQYSRLDPHTRRNFIIFVEHCFFSNNQNESETGIIKFYLHKAFH